MTKDKKAQIKAFIAQYDELERKACTLPEWIALKFSCTIERAQQMIEKV